MHNKTDTFRLDTHTTTHKMKFCSSNIYNSDSIRKDYPYEMKC